jgi:hypothetical protein
MLMVMGMSVALVGTEATSGRTGLNDRSHLPCLELCLPRHNSTGRDARVTAIQTEADASNESSDIVVAEASIGARGTRLSAREARLDAFDECRSI